MQKVTTLFAPAKAWFMIYRILAVLVWAQVVVLISSAVAFHDTGRVDWTTFLLVFAIASLVQGFPAHIINEIFDWKSGADRYRKLGEKSGGSKVLKSGLATEAQLWVMFYLSLCVCLVLIWILYLRTDLNVVLIFCAGFALTIAYTLPPFRMAYRPFIGEWLGGFSGVWLTFCGTYYAQTQTLNLDVLFLAGAIAVVYIGVMILFHYLDFEGDRLAMPRKNTTIVFLGLKRAKKYVIALLALDLAFVAFLMRTFDGVFMLFALLVLAQLIIHLKCDPFLASSIIRAGKYLTYTILAAALVFASIIHLSFLGFLGLILGSFYLHKRFGKLAVAANP